jgi:hypothetical protein
MAICNHCGEDLGDGDSYDLMNAHIRFCDGKVAKQYRKARDEENGWVA